ncbi:MAG: SMP-30/gluconolactonase/LRE family protein [Nannocystaceae bacterium]|nr:SMP-30/gluconolactonase/LRE family protein [Nannocystaceae bacterium]
MTRRSSLLVLALGVGCHAEAASPPVWPPPASTAAATTTAAASPEMPAASTATARPPQAPPSSKPLAVVDLSTTSGAEVVGARWRYRDVAVVPARGRGPGADLRPSGAPVSTLDLSPLPGTPEFERDWIAMQPAELTTRRGHGKLSFGWYRTRVTIPERIGETATAHRVVALEVVLDDYAEVWIDGEIPRELGRSGGQVVAGFNAPNRVVLTRDAVPGQSFDVAVFAMNGPVSFTPDNFLWVRSATLELHDPPEPERVAFELEQRDPRLAALVPPDAVLERVATGFEFTEGPVWHPERNSLLFSDPNRNTIYEWHPGGALHVLRSKSGYTGVDIGRYHQPGSNGLALDHAGRLTIDEHGNRRVTRIEPTGAVTVLAERWQGNRLNSPNDLIYRSDGTLFFTDPPFGLPGAFDDPARELDFAGIYRLGPDGELALASRELGAPNGIALSPDERFLYVGNWEPQRKVVLRWPLDAGGGLGDPETFLDLGAVPGEECIDGLEVDREGNVWVSGPDGVYVAAADGTVLGVLRLREKAHNFAWGDADRGTLYLTARTSVYRLRTGTQGASMPKTAAAAPR